MEQHTSAEHADIEVILLLLNEVDKLLKRCQTSQAMAIYYNIFGARRAQGSV